MPSAWAPQRRSGKLSICEAIAAVARGEGEPLPDVLKIYTRHVTQLWCVVAAILALSAIVTAMVASPELWSLITNIIHYLAMGAVFVLEFAYRRVRYAHLEPWGWLEYLKRLPRARIRM